MGTLERQKFLFLLIENQKLIFHATQWQLRDLTNRQPFSSPRRLSSYDRDFNGPDLHSVDAHISLINELDDESIALKYAESSQYFTEHGPLNKRAIPIAISQADLKDRIRQPTMNRLESTLLSLGFLLPKDGQSDFDLFIYENRMNGRLSINLQKFPLALAFIERENALSRSDLFTNSHWLYRGDKANSLRIFEWFKKMDFALPDGLLDMARRYHGEQTMIEQVSIEIAQSNINPKEHSSLMQMIHVLAARKPYSYDPEDSRNGAISRIQNAFSDAGLSMSDKTIRKYLRESFAEVERLRDKNQ